MREMNNAMEVYVSKKIDQISKHFEDEDENDETDVESEYGEGNDDNEEGEEE